MSNNIASEEIREQLQTALDEATSAETQCEDTQGYARDCKESAADAATATFEASQAIKNALDYFDDYITQPTIPKEDARALISEAANTIDRIQNDLNLLRTRLYNQARVWGLEVDGE